MDGVSPIDNRTPTDKHQHFVQKMNLYNNDTAWERQCFDDLEKKDDGMNKLIR